MDLVAICLKKYNIRRFYDLYARKYQTTEHIVARPTSLDPKYHTVVGNSSSLLGGCVRLPYKLIIEPLSDVVVV